MKPDPAIAKLQKDVDTLAQALNLVLDEKNHDRGGQGDTLKDVAESLRAAAESIANRPSIVGLRVVRGADKKVKGMVAYTDRREIERIMKG